MAENIEEGSLALVSEGDLSLVEDNTLNAKQLQMILKRTPPQYIKTRPAKGGGTWQTVTGGYIKKCLNIMFGWDWDFEIIEQYEKHGQVITQGKLTCRSSGGKTIVKMQIGRKDIAYKTKTIDIGNGKTRKEPTDIPLDYGNDCKASATDCLKKCASEIGIAADVYNKEDFREVFIKADGEEVEEQQQEEAPPRSVDTTRVETPTILTNTQNDDFQL